jgi:hypothetical protein
VPLPRMYFSRYLSFRHGLAPPCPDAALSFRRSQSPADCCRANSYGERSFGPAEKRLLR